MHKMLRRGGVTLQQLGMGRRFNIEQWQNWTQSHPTYRVFMTEMGFNQYQPPHALTLFREPVSHVLSQYFHCKESIEHNRLGKADAMPDTLLEWLKAWHEIKQRDPQIERNMSDPFIHWRDPNFTCFIPLNFQSWLTMFPESKDDLLGLFDAVGVMDDMDLSYCVFATTILQKVPDDCNCSTGQPVTKLPAKMADHGVLHHGSSFTPTDEELSLIQEFTQLDQKLYQLATELFEEQVSEVEQVYSVKLCRKAS